jgi:DNA-binding NarL/FixJ family response regulator
MIRTAIIEDNNRYREFLKLIIGSDPQLSLVYVSADANSLTSILTELPDVLIIDLDLPGKSGVEAITSLRQLAPTVIMLVLTVFEDEEKILKAIKAGASGYMLKKDSPQRILDSIKEVYEGKSPINGMVSKRILSFIQSPVKSAGTQENLTDRETEILSYLMEGLSYKEMAERCFISVYTLNTHVKHIYKKFSVNSRAQLAAKLRR